MKLRNSDEGAPGCSVYVVCGGLRGAVWRMRGVCVACHVGVMSCVSVAACTEQSLRGFNNRFMNAKITVVPAQGASGYLAVWSPAQTPLPTNTAWPNPGVLTVVNSSSVLLFLILLHLFTLEGRRCGACAGPCTGAPGQGVRCFVVLPLYKICLLTGRSVDQFCLDPLYLPLNTHSVCSDLLVPAVLR